MIQLRLFQPEDIPAVTAVFVDAVTTLGRWAYSAEQVAVWAAATREATFAEHLLAGFTLVTVVEGHIAAFGQLDPPDHVNFLYCAARFARQGHGSLILNQLETAARSHRVPTLTTEASRIAKPFFEAHGFKVIQPEWVERQGLQFERYRMEKPLDHPGAS